MKSSSDLIAKQVFSVNAFYTKKQNETKELFFRCLRERRSTNYFEIELNKIWNNIDHKFMDKQILKLEKLVNSNNVEEALNLGRFDGIYQEGDYWVIDGEYFKLTGESEFIKFEQRFKYNVLNNYRNSRNAMANLDKQTYLENKIDTYNRQVNQVITYFDKYNRPLREVQLSSYLSMIHNTDLTRAGWNQTISDSKKLNRDLFIIPYHSFSCPYCLSYQNQIMTADEVMDVIGIEAREQQGDLLHPNCRCTLSIYWDSSQIGFSKYSFEESEEFYKLRQKVNTLTLEKSNLRTDMKIANEIGDQAKVDKCRQRINAINRAIRDIKEQLPTEEMEKQITAIKR
jgi:hypothetical protein